MNNKNMNILFPEGLSSNVNNFSAPGIFDFNPKIFRFNSGFMVVIKVVSKRIQLPLGS
jgi:hypothetical protein